MKPIFAKCVILLLLILTFGCTTVNRLTQDGIDQPIPTMAEHLGPPTRVIPDGKGGSIYIWEQWVPMGWHNGDLMTNTFFVDSNGIIYKWR